MSARAATAVLATSLPLDSSRSPGRAEDAWPPSWPHPPSAPCTDASHRAPLSTPVDTGAGAVFDASVVRCGCARTAAPATTPTDMTTASSLIRPPFTDFSASLDDPIAPVAIKEHDTAEPVRDSSPGVTRRGAIAL